MKHGIWCWFVAILVLIQSIPLPIIIVSSAIPKINKSTNLPEEDINIALLLQRWDYMDLLIFSFVVPFYNIRMSQIQRLYPVNINFTIFWDKLDGGDVQSGKLVSKNIDVAIGPGGVGSFYTPDEYRAQLKSFIENGGGFFGICGDSYLGSVGHANAPDNHKELIYKLFKYPELTPPIGLIPVLCDAKPFTDLFIEERTQNNIFVLLFLVELIFSNSKVMISDAELPFANNLRGKIIDIEMGSAPFILNDSKSSSNYTIIGKFGECNSPYNNSLFEGKIAIIIGPYEKGRVILSSPHPEISFLRPEANDLFFQALFWLAKKENLRQ
jgi:glutamine amidotransferase-like uncharacterized protein